MKNVKNLKHGNALLFQIAEGLKEHDRSKLGNLKVTFTSATRQNDFVFSLTFALHAIANDLYWDETGDWSECDTAIVESF